MADQDQIKAEFRRRMLMIARLDGPRYGGRFVPAVNFLRATDDEGNVVEDAQVEPLLDDLIGWGLLEEPSEMDLGGAKANFRHRRFRSTPKARALWLKEIDPIVGVADERFGD